MPIVVEENAADPLMRLRELLPSMPPSGKVTLVGAALLVCQPSHVLDVMSQMNISAPHIVADLEGRPEDTGVQFFSMQYCAENSATAPTVSSWLLPRSAHEDALAAMLNCRYGNILLGLQMKDYRIAVEMPQCSVEESTQYVAMFNKHVRDMIISQYSQKVFDGADSNSGAADALSKNIVKDTDMIAAHCCRVWESPIGIYLCTKQGILVVPNTHPHSVALHASVYEIAPELSIDNWLSIIVAPQGVRFHLGTAGTNAELRKDIDEKLKKDVDAGKMCKDAARDLADHIEADFDLANLACAWMAAWKIDHAVQQYDIYPACAIDDYIKDAMTLYSAITSKNRMCILTPNGQKNCCFHGRHCRKNQRLDPIAVDYHVRQRTQGANVSQ